MSFENAFHLSCFKQVLTLFKWLAWLTGSDKYIFVSQNPCCMCSCVHVDIYREHHGYRAVFALWFDCCNQEEILSQSLLG